MNELELWLIKEDFLNNETFVPIYIYNNNLQDKLTLKEAAFVTGKNIQSIFYLLFGFDNIYAVEEYIFKNPDVINMKISDISNLT